MTLRAVRPTGLEYLALITDLLQRQRLSDPVAGLFEAADLQWHFTRDPHPDDADAVVWLDGDVPVTAAVISRWSAGKYGCDVLGDASLDEAWDFVRLRCAELDAELIEMEIDAADTALASAAVRAGFTERTDAMATSWLDAADRAATRPLPDGYTIRARSEQDGPHPMIARNGDRIEEHLRECSLYDPDLDLALFGPDGAVAGYAMFWADPRTHVGLVEPMRVEDDHAGRGLAGTLLRTGLDALVAHGCTRLTISHDPSNPAAARVYSGAGFRIEKHTDVRRYTGGNELSNETDVRDVSTA